MDKLDQVVVAVVGLGYVGLPLAVAFGTRFRTIGLDRSPAKVAAYCQYRDSTGEVGEQALRAARWLTCTTDASLLREADVVIVAVPTPVDRAHRPDFGPLIDASTTVGRHLKRGAIVVFESTVYPGATEEVCIPVLEQSSGWRWKQDFYVGYSPERINPGDREHTLERVVKVVAGDTPQTLETLTALYGTVVPAGIHQAPSIRVAEAAKVIENTQRDLNIALVNELALLFDRLGLDTTEVLQAAATKWNFLPFKPGLVGGHCIGVDPYYLTHKAEMVGYHPQVILAGRRINDGMGKFVAEKTVKLMIQAGINIKGARVNVLGLSFKENCPDIRNSRVPDIIAELQSYGVEVAVHDPLADAQDAQAEYGLTLQAWESLPEADALVLAVAHEAYRALGVSGLAAKVRQSGVVVDVKAMFARDAFAPRLGWRL
jgi:UDP-N-acetyl-D-galactosamine dehydrogenase